MYQTKGKQIWPFMSFSLKFPIQSVYFWRHSHSTSLKVWGIVGGGNKLVKLLQISVKSQIVGSQGSKDVRSDWSDTPRIGVRLQISISSRWRVWAEITPKHENRSKGLISPSCSKILALGNATPTHPWPKDEIGSIYWDVARFLLEMFSPLFKLQQKVNLKEVFSAADGHGDEDGRDGIWFVHTG